MTKVNEKNNGWVNVCEGVSVRGSRKRFSINWHGAVIHGCRIAESKTGAFISWPAFKGKDGNYVKTAYIYAPERSLEANILDRIVLEFCTAYPNCPN